MGKRDNIEPAGPQSEQAKKAQEQRHEQRQRDIDRSKKDGES
jgi:hypothetical protein